MMHLKMGRPDLSLDHINSILFLDNIGFLSELNIPEILDFDLIDQRLFIGLSFEL